jgi:hypothetical protein
MPAAPARPIIRSNIIMLTADAFGVMPPIAKLTPEQAMYHFLSGYTAKVAGTEKGVTEPEATFSTCFGAPFMPRHPSEYGALLRKLINDTSRLLAGQHRLDRRCLWPGQRMPIKATRTLLTAALDGSLEAPNTATIRISASRFRSRLRASTAPFSIPVQPGRTKRPMTRRLNGWWECLSTISRNSKAMSMVRFSARHPLSRMLRSSPSPDSAGFWPSRLTGSVRSRIFCRITTAAGNSFDGQNRRDRCAVAAAPE